MIDGVSDFERIEALFLGDELYLLADIIPLPPQELGGRPRDYPLYAYLAFGALIHVYRSARNAAAQLNHPVVWRFIQDLVRRRFPNDPDMWLPDRPMRRHHWTEFRESRVVQTHALQDLERLHELVAAEHALRLGLCTGLNGSLSHPALENCQVGDGFVNTALRGGRGERTKVNRKTGEIRTIKGDPDAALHLTGTGEKAYGVKFAFTATRGDRPHERIILAFDHVPKGDEARVAVELFDRTLTLLPGTQAVNYDGAFRGKHRSFMIRHHGVNVITPAPAAVSGKKDGQERVERVKLIDTVTIEVNGKPRTLALYTKALRLHLGVVAVDGSLVLTPLERIRTERRGTPGAYRLYGLYRLPESEGAGTVRVPFHATKEDSATGLNRAEHLSGIAPGDPDFERLYGRRSDAESINRGFKDRHYLHRAHSIGKDRQLVDMLTHALLVNAVAVHRYAQQGDPPVEQAA